MPLRTAWQGAGLGGKAWLFPAIAGGLVRRRC